MKKYSIYIKKFKIALGILVAIFVLLIFMLSKIIPQFKNISAIQQNYKTTTAELADSERRLTDLKTSKEKSLEEESNVLKEFFNPVNGGLDTEAIISDEFGEILQLMRENKIKARAFKYDYDPNDDNFVKYVGNRFHVCRVTADLIATYSQFENFLRDLFKHEHFLEISTVEVTPYQKNKRILLINLKIKLYAKKDPSYVEDTSDSTAANLDQKNNDDSANESDKESDEESDEESDDESDS